MHDALLVSEDERVTHLHERAEIVLEQIARARRCGPRGIAKAVVPRDALNSAHHDERRAVVGRGDLVDGHDARVLEKTGDPRFAQNGERVGVGGVGPQRLHRDDASKRRLHGASHDAHATFAEHFTENERAIVLAGKKLARRFSRGLLRDRIVRIGDRRVGRIGHSLRT